MPAPAREERDEHGDDCGSGGGGGGRAGEGIRASGAIVEVGPDAFLTLLAKLDQPLVIAARGRFFQATFRYLAPYRGVVLFAESEAMLRLPDTAEVIEAGSIWVPS
jgi:hypothetical protein